jgi:uncharacterized repeat protein (TIGR01451 family)
VTSTPANGASYALGETISYLITVTNDGNVTAMDIDVIDSLSTTEGQIIGNIASLAPGAFETFIFQYAVTEADLLAGNVVNTASITGGVTEDPDNPEPPVTPGEITIPVVAPNASFTLDKVLTNLPDRGTFNAGETATFSITITNNGNVTLDTLTITEELANATILAGEGYTVTGNAVTLQNIQPSATVILQATYTVTANDLGNEELYNRVTATGAGANLTASGGDEARIPTSDRPVVVPTAAPTVAPPVELVEVAGTKQWVENDPAIRPTTIMVRLLADGVETLSTTVSAADNWAYSFTDLPRDTAEGIAINYSVVEDAVPGYVTTYQGYDITNTQAYTLTIRYWYESVGGASAATTVSRPYGFGEVYNVASPRIDGYVASQAAVVGIMTGDVVYDVVYSQNDYGLTITYVYQDGSTAAPTYQATLRVNDVYDIASPVLSGYVASVERVSGTMSGRNAAYTVIYVRAGSANMTIIDEYGTPLNIGNVVMNVGDCFE